MKAPGAADADAETAANERRPLLAAVASSTSSSTAGGGGQHAPGPTCPHPKHAAGGEAPGVSASSGGGGEVVIDVAEAPRQHSMDAAREPCSRGDAGEPRTCRICFETEESPADGDPSNPLISPCLCSGSSRYVHRKCLQQWRASSHRQDAHWQCEVCKYRYRYSRAWWAGILGAPATRISAVAAVLAAAVLALGFVPVLGPSPLQGAGLSHALNGLVMLGILGVVMSAALFVARACGVMAAPFFDPGPACWMCLDCQGGCEGAGLWMNAAHAGELAAALAAVVALVLVAAGVLASAVIVLHFVEAGVQAGLSRAQRLVENIGDDPPRPPAPVPPAPPAGSLAAAASGGSSSGSSSSSSSGSDVSTSSSRRHWNLYG